MAFLFENKPTVGRRGKPWVAGFVVVRRSWIGGQHMMPAALLIFPDIAILWLLITDWLGSGGDRPIRYQGQSEDAKSHAAASTQKSRAMTAGVSAGSSEEKQRFPTCFALSPKGRVAILRHLNNEKVCW